jgi:hypothetical protein
MPILISVKPSANPKKKWTATFRMPEDKFKSVSFGDPTRDDYLKHKDQKRRDAYLSRHARDLRTNDPLKAGYLAYYITWSGFPQQGKPTTSLPKLIKMYNKKFFKK